MSDDDAPTGQELLPGEADGTLLGDGENHHHLDGGDRPAVVAELVRVRAATLPERLGDRQASEPQRPRAKCGTRKDESRPTAAPEACCVISCVTAKQTCAIFPLDRVRSGPLWASSQRNSGEPRHATRLLGKALRHLPRPAGINQYNASTATRIFHGIARSASTSIQDQDPQRHLQGSEQGVRVEGYRDDPVRHHPAKTTPGTTTGFRARRRLVGLSETVTPVPPGGGPMLPSPRSTRF
ncbi:MAG: hypothetical protein U0793_32550 [Gemmataceae bacterium]